MIHQTSLSGRDKVSISSSCLTNCSIRETAHHSCYRDAWKSTVYNVKTVSTDISGNIHRKCPIFFSWPLFTRLDDYQNNSSLSDHLISLVLIPGGFYYWRDASSTMVHHCQKADLKESKKVPRVANRNQASEPYETFCTLTRHPNTPLGPKNPKNPTQEPPQKRFSFRKCDERGWKSTLSTLPRKRKS